MLLRNSMDGKPTKLDAKSFAIVLVGREVEMAKKRSLKQDIWEASVLLESLLQLKEQNIGMELAFNINHR